jgi:endogenous inhibitor of DNA gyrase (YacG/DUF329 family)
MSRTISAYAIKRCPVCGKSIGRALVDWENKGDRIHRVYVECPMCRARTNSYATQNLAIESWNDGNVSTNRTYQESLIGFLEVKNG